LRLFRAIPCGILNGDEAEAKVLENYRQTAGRLPVSIHYATLV